jgi:hypothetical protein
VTVDKPANQTAPAPGVAEPASAGDSEGAKPGLVAQLRDLYDDGRELVDAEISFQKARVSAAGRQVRAMAALAFVGLVFIVGALIALVVGTMMALAPLLGEWGAMGATVGGTLLLAMICFWLALRRIARVTALFGGESDESSPNGQKT